jgi:hypothetical protein
MRSGRVVVAAILALFAVTTGGAIAQTPGAGTLVGHLIVCRPIIGPSGTGGGASPDLTGATPGLKRGLPKPIQFPAQDVQLAVQGTTISATTDASGLFVLAGVPAAQPLTLLAQASSGPPLLFSGSSPVVSSGQMLDLGTLGIGDCATTVFLPQPPPSTDGSFQALSDAVASPDGTD